MFEKPCKLWRAARSFMGGGGGGGTDINQLPGGFRSWPKEKKDIKSGYDFQQGQFNQFGENNPLLNAANTSALSYNQGLPAMLAQFTGFGNEVGGYQNQLSNLFGKLGGQANTLGGWLNAANGPASIISSGGALTPQMSRDVAQQTRSIQSAQGTAHGNAALGTELLNRDSARQTRYNTALQQGQGLLGQQQGVYGAQGGMAQLGAGLTGQKAGLLGQKQGLQTGGLNQLLGTLGGGVSAFGGLTNPILGYLGNMFGGNQQAAISQAQVNAQQNAAASGKAGSTAGGAISAIGSLLPLLAAFSDERVKTKITATGIDTKEGVPLKTWEYKTNPGVRFLGATAQDIEKKLPSAVFTDPRSGLKVIDVTQFPVVQISAVKPTKKAA